MSVPAGILNPGGGCEKSLSSAFLAAKASETDESRADSGLFTVITNSSFVPLGKVRIACNFFMTSLRLVQSDTADDTDPEDDSTAD